MESMTDEDSMSQISHEHNYKLYISIDDVVGCPMEEKITANIGLVSEAEVWTGWFTDLNK